MITADVVFLVSVFVCLAIGFAVGFATELKLFAGGVFGVIISALVCYFLLGVVLSWPFVQDLITKFNTVLVDANSGICNFLLTIRADLILVAIILFILVQIVRMIVVHTLVSVMRRPEIVIVVLNRLFGVLLLVAFAAILALVAFQIIAWVQGVDGSFYQSLTGSIFGLDKIFVDNPLNALFQLIQNPF